MQVGTQTSYSDTRKQFVWEYAKHVLGGPWAALRSLIACDAPKPDWRLADGLTATEEEAMWQAVDKCISTAWYGLLGAAHTLRIVEH